MKVVFRADASDQMGTGHLMRCLTLARELRLRGAEVRFVAREHRGHLVARLQDECLPVTVLPPPEAEATDPDIYGKWRGVPVARDAGETLAAIGRQPADWLVVDHYGLGSDWETALRPGAHRILAIDDLPERAHACDLLLNQNLGATCVPLPPGARALLGPKYALLHPAFAERRGRVRNRDRAAGRVVVFFGGADETDLTGRTLAVLSEPEFSGLFADVVVGASSPHRERLVAQAATRPQTLIHGPMSHLADLLAGADVAIGAGGATTWERLCLGVPSVVTAVAENQVPACLALEAAGLALFTGTKATWQPGLLRTALRRLIGAPDFAARLGDAGAAVVDGFGAKRVAEAMLPTPVAAWSVRPAGAERSGGATVRGFSAAAQGLPLGSVRLATDGEETTVEFDVEDDGRSAAVRGKLLGSAVALLRGAEPLGLRTGADASLRRMRLREPAADSGLRLSLLSDAASWLNEPLAGLVVGWLADGHSVAWVHRPEDLGAGDLCFLVGCGQLVPADIRRRHRHNLVVHESALPHGRGWSPFTWQVLEGKSEIPVSLLEAEEAVDSGAIHDRDSIRLLGAETIDELRAEQARATLALCRRFVARFPAGAAEGRAQQGEPSYYPRRRPADSRLDPDRTLRQLFNQLRVADPVRYPAFFELAGRRFELRIAPAPEPEPRPVSA